MIAGNARIVAPRIGTRVNKERRRDRVSVTYIRSAAEQGARWRTRISRWWAAMTRDREPLMSAECASSGRILEIACDESGYEGDKLIGTTTDVFAHASVQLSGEAAEDCIRELRGRIGSPATEYKANHILREKSRPALEWLFGPSGPLRGTAKVQLIDKAFFVVGKVLDLLVERVGHPASIGLHQDRQAKATAVTLYRDGRRAFSREQWGKFLVSANNLMRVKSRGDVRVLVDAFFHSVGALRLAGAPERVEETLARLVQARPQADALRAHFLDDPRRIPVADPLVPAIVEAIDHWSGGGSTVRVVHDQQNSLSGERIAQIKEIFGHPDPTLLGYVPTGSLADLALVDSLSDPRVQVADFLAGVARKIASDELNNRGTPELTALLRPYVNPHSVWGDDRSWALLKPASSFRLAEDGPGLVPRERSR
ncbi:hypothetical protein [Saccharopolyspora shandongensis]|nr:hypothetical protein [Saccharopolyspora shandongensis]